MASRRKHVYRTLGISMRGRKGISLIINIFLIVIIFLNTVAIIINSIPAIGQEYHHLFLDFELFSVIIFSIEYLLRIWSCVENENYRDPFWGRIKYTISFWSLVDLLAILPFFLSFLGINFALIRMLRLFRIFRLFRVTRYFHALKMIQNVIRNEREELLLSFAMIIFLLIVSSSLMFYVEHEAQPKAFSSIPAAMWWGVNAMTTVGYGDIHPITPLGKLLGGIIAILGVATFALPTGILTSGFIEQLREKREKQGSKCPHCGKEIHSH